MSSSSSQQRQMLRKKIRSVFIVGGTHGNERGGIHLAKYFETQQSSKWPTLSVRGIIANEEACKINRRYVQEDLNRCFSNLRLSTPTATYESQRAIELNQLLGPKGSSTPKADFIFDLHNSTSNTGMMLCFHQNDLLAREVAAHLNKVDSTVKLVHWPGNVDQPFLPTIAGSGMTVELGPIAHGTVHAKKMERVRQLVMNGLDYLNRKNLVDESAYAVEDHSVRIGERLISIDFPRDEKNQDASSFVHTDLQDISELDEDSYLRPNQPIFSSVDGSVTERFDPKKYHLPENERYYPVFINEAAYFEKQTAFFLYRRGEKTNVKLLSNIIKSKM